MSIYRPGAVIGLGSYAINIWPVWVYECVHKINLVNNLKCYFNGMVF